MTTFNNQLSPKGARLYKIAGWGLFGICLLHLAFWSVATWRSWPGWISGKLWDVTNQSYEATKMHFHFWALPGSFMVPLLLLSLLMVRAAKHKDKLPTYIGWGLLAWVIACWLMLLPSGFVLGVIPAILLIAANRK